MSGERFVLAIDTATAPGGVAVGIGTDVVAEVVLGTAARHSELGMPAVDFALRAAGASMAEVDAIVCGSGPGSFTGVRIAAATAKGLAHARGVPLYVHSSLLAAAAAAASPDPVCALFDARRGEAYGGCWRLRDGGPEVILEPLADDVESIVERVRRWDPLFVGDGAWSNRDRIEALGGRLAAPGATTGCAGALIRLHAHDPHPVPVDTARWEPTYIRAPNVTMPRGTRQTPPDRSRAERA